MGDENGVGSRGIELPGSSVADFHVCKLFVALECEVRDHVNAILCGYSNRTPSDCGYDCRENNPVAHAILHFSVTAPSSISLRNQRDDTAPHSALKVDPPWPSRDTESAFAQVWYVRSRSAGRVCAKSAYPSAA